MYHHRTTGVKYALLLNQTLRVRYHWKVRRVDQPRREKQWVVPGLILKLG